MTLSAQVIHGMNLDVLGALDNLEAGGFTAVHIVRDE